MQGFLLLRMEPNWVQQILLRKAFEWCCVYGNVIASNHVAVGNIDVNAFSTFAASVDGVVYGFG